MQTKEKKTYKIMTKTVNIQYEERVEDEDGSWIYGKIHYSGPTVTISISTKDENGKKLDKDTIECTLRHELFHLIFDVLYFTDLSQNETLVEWLANATMQLKKQGLSI